MLMVIEEVCMEDEGTEDWEGDVKETQYDHTLWQHPKEEGQVEKRWKKK